jgi:Sulfotransferase family
MTNNLIITGIPRSGTSYLCSILNKTKNTVVINEPEEIFQILRNGSEAPLSRYYEYIRERVNNGLPIANKLVNGKFIEDTNITDARSTYTPHVATSDFVLGTKNTLIYLNTLRRVIKSLPEAVIIACVRHPYDTIASWSKVSFPHIRNAAPQFLLNYTTGEEKESINRIMQTTDLAVRYATWWSHLAGIINKNRDRLIPVNYESMVSSPESTLNLIYEAIPFQAELQQPLEASSPRHHENALDSNTISAINEHCKDAAALLGYVL